MKYDIDELGNIESRMQRIKENLVAAVIMNTVRNLEDDYRKTFKKFCEHVIQDDERLH
jgi:hypothetical protein